MRVTAGVSFSYAGGRPALMLRGVSVMGVPLPNAWLGGMKDIDIGSRSGENGFWKAFADGAEDVRVEDGQISIPLKK